MSFFHLTNYQTDLIPLWPRQRTWVELKLHHCLYDKVCHSWNKAFRSFVATVDDDWFKHQIIDFANLLSKWTNRNKYAKVARNVLLIIFHQRRRLKHQFSKPEWLMHQRAYYIPTLEPNTRKISYQLLDSYSIRYKSNPFDGKFFIDFLGDETGISLHSEPSNSNL